jgi:predicted RNase H-like HicB family nuclease
MVKKRYPALIAPRRGGYHVVFPDFPGCSAEGPTPGKADAIQALEQHVASMQGQPLPEPSDVRHLPDWLARGPRC